MGFDRNLLPDPTTYFESQGLKLIGPRSSAWKTTECRFHGSSDSMRVNTKNGAWVCMAGCGARGGDVLHYEMTSSGLDFVQGAKLLGAWVADGKPEKSIRPTLLSPRQALSALAFESFFITVQGLKLEKGASIHPRDLKRLVLATRRIQKIAEMYS